MAAVVPANARQGPGTGPSRARWRAGEGAFLAALSGIALNERQVKVLNRLLDGFEDNLTSSKWATLSKTSNDTALRDINELVELGILQRSGAGGRSTSYDLVRKPAGTQY